MISFEWNDETKWILGRPNFWCGPIADRLRQLGHSIARKGEEEQAYVIHWMLSLYTLYKEKWREAGEIALSEKSGNAAIPSAEE